MGTVLSQFFYLRNRLASGGASLLVGSGFSKNVHSEFPLWREMLYDMVIELFRYEIDLEVGNLPDQAKEKAIVEAVNRIMDNTGLLEIVSLYIQRKGYAESIVAYIEDHIPIIEEGDGFYLNLKSGPIRLTEEHLALHKKLVSLPWNNIYTTNVDPLLESCVDTKAFTKLSDENISLASEIESLDAKLSEERPKRDEIQQLISELHEKSGGEDMRARRRFRAYKPNQEAPQPLTSEEKHELNNLYKQQDELINSIGNKEQRIRDAGFVRANNEKAKLHTYTVVLNGAELQLKKNKNIIKLHGSLRSREERCNNAYGFDGDPHKQYVFSSEHYASYPEKHQAFTQLMRISLLQECFCLIGFSGMDPNFLSWISWVRDILIRHTQKQGNKPYKIFLLDMTSKSSTDAERLFYENHSIIRIPMLATDTVDDLSKVTKIQFDTEHRESSVMNLLFRFFEMDEEIAVSQIKPKDNQYEKRWERAWDGLGMFGLETITEIKIQESLAIIQPVVEKLPSLYFSRYKSRDLTHFLMALNYHLNHVSAQSRSPLLKLAVIASKYSFVPIRSLVEEETIKEMLETPETMLETKLLLIRNDTYSSPQAEFEPGSVNPYDAILRAAYSLKYDEMLKLLREWNPEPANIHLKAGLLAWFDAEEAEKLMKIQLENNAVEGQDALISLELRAFIRKIRPNSEKDDTLVRIEAMKGNGYVDFRSLTEFLASQTKIKPEKLEPYGKGRFTLSRSIDMSGNEKAIPAIQMLCLLAESGFSLEFGYLYMVSEEEWYQMFKNGFEHFPLPFLFYSLQLHKADALTRIAQDYAFSQKVDHLQIVLALQHGYRTIPDFRRDSVLVVLSELIKVVEPQKWQVMFFQVFRDHVENGKLFDQVRNDEIKSFVRNGLSLVDDRNLIFEMIITLLKHPQFPIADLLYYFSINATYKSLSPADVPSDLASEIDDYIATQQNMANDFFVFGNLFSILSAAQKNRIREKISSIDISQASHPKTWRVMTFFIENDPSLGDKMKKAVLQSKLLWQTGIDGTTVSGNIYGVLSLASLTRSNRYPKGLSWTNEEVFLLYNKLKLAWMQLQTISEDRDFLTFDELLDEMNYFLITHHELLCSDPQYLAVRNGVWGRLVRSRKYDSVVEGLISTDQTVVLWAVGDLELLADAEAVDDELRLLFLNKIYMQAGAGIEASLNLLASWVKNPKAEAGFRPFIPRLLAILQRYKDYPLHESDILFVEGQMITIAHMLFLRGVVAPEIDYWKEKALSTRSVFIQQRFGISENWVRNISA